MILMIAIVIVKFDWLQNRFLILFIIAKNTTLTFIELFLPFNAVLCAQGYHALQVHRVAHALWHQGRKVLALALQSRVSEVVF